MNAPAAPAAVTAAFQLIPIAALRPSSTTIQALRRKRFDKAALAELADSIRRHGVAQPIVVRPRLKVRVRQSDIGPQWYAEVLNIAGTWNVQGVAHSDKAAAEKAAEKLREDWEIIAGEHRWRAAKEAGLEAIPAMVRDADDGQVIEIQLLENMHRRDLHPLEEAEGYAELMKAKKIKPADVADLVDKSRSWVFGRMKLLELCPEAREAFYEGTLNASIANLIARIPQHDTQRAALKQITTPEWNDEMMSFRDAQELIHSTYMADLKGVAFKLDDATLVPKAGSCSLCPKRTGNQKDLFTDVKNPNVCTDPKCLQDKKEAYNTRIRAEAEAKGQKVIGGKDAKRIFPYGSNNVGGGYASLDTTAWDDPQHRKVRQIVGKEVIELAQHPTTGELVQVVRNTAITEALNAAGIKTHRQKMAAQDATRRKKAGAAAGTGDERILAAIDSEYEERLIMQIRAKLPKQLGAEELRQIVAALTWNDDLHEISLKHWKLPPTRNIDPNDKSLKTLSAAQLAQLLMELMITTEVEYKGTGALEEAAKRYKIDHKALLKTVTEEIKAKAAPKDAKPAAIAKVKSKAKAVKKKAKR